MQHLKDDNESMTDRLDILEGQKMNLLNERDRKDREIKNMQ